ncbi:hypothetical protein [Streptomyces sp. NRRL F-5065]|uniref:hypothetical protein n=1 Tax=Streptomyces sp. NRRL F-5065 TaxID=1463855 RepID=UPI001F2FAC5B|nr:hypothetical protein [Streptomyces sp. NRRL F-5065]
MSTVFTSALEDRVIRANPCSARSVRAPRLEPRKVKPWPAERIMDVRSALPDRYQALVNVAAGCGLRQGEVFGLAVEDVDFLGGVVHVVRQVNYCVCTGRCSLPRRAARNVTCLCRSPSPSP